MVVAKLPPNPFPKPYPALAPAGWAGIVVTQNIPKTTLKENGYPNEATNSFTWPAPGTKGGGEKAFLGTS